MTQIDALIMVVVLGLIVCWAISFCPKSISPFYSGDAKMYLGLSVGFLLLNLWPVFSKDVLVNKSGEEIYPFPFGYASVVFSLFFLVMAFRAEKSGMDE